MVHRSHRPHDKNILAEVAKVTSFTQVKTMTKEDAVKAGLFVTIGKEIDDRYMEELKKQSNPSGDYQRDGKGHQELYTHHYMEPEIFRCAVC
mgnify:CR=1 FL=1